MKNVIEVLFQFKDIGAEAIDENRKKLSLMAKELQNTADQAEFIVNSQKKMDKAIRDSSNVNNEAAIEEKRIAKEKEAIAKEELRIIKEAAKEKIKINKEIQAEEKLKAKEAKELAKAQILAAKEKANILKLASINERNALVEQLRIKREKSNAEKEAMLLSNRAAREAERAAKIETDAQKKIVLEQQKTLKAQEKLNAAKNKKTTNTDSKDANNNLKSTISNLNLTKIAIAGAAAAAVAAIVIFAKRSAEEFYKMKLAAEQTGIDIRFVQTYKKTLDSVGISVDEFTQKIRQMNEKFVEGFTEGSGDGMEVLKTLNLDIEEFAKLRPEEKFEKFYEITKDLSEVQKLQMFDKIGIDRLNLIYNRMEQIKEEKERISRTGMIITDEEAGRLNDFENSWNSLKTNLGTFSTLIYSSIIPATKDAFDGIFGGFELTRDGANFFSVALIEIIQFFAKIANYGRLALDMLIVKLKTIGLYSTQAAAAIGYMWDQMSLSLDTVIQKIKSIDLGTAIADISKKTFNGIIDIIFESLGSIVSGIQSIANKISGVIPDALLENLNGTQNSIKAIRKKLYTYEKSEEQKINDEKIKTIEAQAKIKSDKLKSEWEQRKDLGRSELDALKKEGQEDALNFAIRAEDISSKISTDYISTIDEALKTEEKEKQELIKLVDETEERSKIIDELLNEVDNIKLKIELGILKDNGESYNVNDILNKYNEAIDVASKDSKLLNKELSLRVKKVEELNSAADKDLKNVKDRIDTLKLIDELDMSNFGKNRSNIISGYNEMIELAKTQGKTELEINTIIKDRDAYQNTFIEKQKEINAKLKEMEFELLEQEGNSSKIRQQRREDELNAVREMFKNATEEERNNALSMTNRLFDVNDAKARIAEIKDELDTLIDKRDNNTSLFNTSELLSLETEINAKLAERADLEDKLNIKREEGNKKYLLTLGQLKDILNTTYENLSTLITSSVTGVNSLKDATKNFFNSTLQYIAKLLQQLIVMKALGYLSGAFGISSNVGALAGAGSSSLPGFAVGGSVSSKGGDGKFNGMGSLKSDEVNAILHDKEAVLTKQHQNNLGNYISDLENNKGGTPIQNEIKVNISADSLMSSIAKTSGFSEAVQMAVKSDRATYKQLLNT